MTAADRGFSKSGDGNVAIQRYASYLQAARKPTLGSAQVKGRPPARKSPQQKKTESYAKDRRNVYGENDKASRKNIPRRKAALNRADRRTVGQALSVIDRLDEGAADLVESSARKDVERMGAQWSKLPDMPLGLFLKKRKPREKAKIMRRVASASVDDSDV